MASYQHLARYNDCSFGTRAKCTADIRERQREALFESRNNYKLRLFLRNRNLKYQLSARCSSSHEEVDEDDECDSNYDSYDTVDGNHNDQYSLSGTNSWQLGGWSSRCSTASPPLSHTSDGDFHQQSSSETQSPEIKERRSVHRRKDNQTRREMLQTRKRLNYKHYDQNLVEQDYLTLKSQLLGNLGRDLAHSLIQARCNVLVNAVEGRSSQIAVDCLQFLAHIVSTGLIEASTVTHILQQGLMMSIKNALTRNLDIQAKVIDLLLCLINQDPRTVPCLVETISHSQLLDMLEETISIGTTADTKRAMDFYQVLFNILTQQLINGTKLMPIVPAIVAQTNSMEAILQMYSPTMTLKDLIQYHLVDSMISRFVVQGLLVDDDTMLLQAINLLINCLWFCNLQVSKSTVHDSWAKEILSIYRSRNFESALLRIVNSDNQIHPAVRSHLKEFLAFYQNTMIVSISPR